MRKKSLSKFLMSHSRKSAASPFKANPWTAPREALKNLRRQAGLTPAQAAELSNAPVAQWRSWEVGEAKMPAATCRAFVERLAKR